MLKSILIVLSFSSIIGHAAAPPKVGAKAPDFTLSGSDGKSYKLSQFTKEHKIVVLEWFNKDCPYVHKFYDSKTMQGLQEKALAQQVVWLTIASSAEGKEGFLKAADAAKVREEKGMKSTALLLDGKGVVAHMYFAKTTPHMFVIDKKGKLAYEGAIDDQPSAIPKSLEGATNYVSLALESLLKNESVKTNSTTPYGCGVKYE